VCGLKAGREKNRWNLQNPDAHIECEACEVFNHRVVEFLAGKVCKKCQVFLDAKLSFLNEQENKRVKSFKILKAQKSWNLKNLKIFANMSFFESFFPFLFITQACEILQHEKFKKPSVSFFTDAYLHGVLLSIISFATGIRSLDENCQI
jgi:hypothetical protein